MSRVLSCRLVTAETKVRYQGNICEIYGRVALAQILLRALRFPLSVSPMLHTHQRNNTLLSKDTQATLGNLQTSDALMRYRGELDRKP
jgi:hypothetical protein